MSCLLYVVDLIVFALLVASDLPFRLFPQVTDAPDLCALPHGVLHRLGECQASLPHPFVQASVDCERTAGGLEVDGVHQHIRSV